MTVTERFRQLADTIDAENYCPLLPPATQMIDGIEQIRTLVPDGRLSMTVEWQRGKPSTVYFGVYDETFNSLAFEPTLNAVVANAIRKIQSNQQSKDSLLVPAEIALSIALPEPEELAF
jgi:hypothetical protein